MASKKPRQAARFWRAENSGHRLTFQLREPSFNSNLLQPDAECAVDAPLREAIGAGLLDGSLIAMRVDLTAVALSAWAAAAGVYALNLAAPERRDRAAKAVRLADALAEFVSIVEDEAHGADRLSDKWDEDADAASLWAIVEHGKALVPLLGRYAEPQPVEITPPATDHLQRRYFRALGKWWDRHAIEPERRGAAAIRNRIAVALWVDMGQTVPDGYADYDFAHRGFRLGKIDP